MGAEGVVGWEHDLCHTNAPLAMERGDGEASLLGGGGLLLPVCLDPTCSWREPAGKCAVGCAAASSSAGWFVAIIQERDEGRPCTELGPL
jgi:hypothetical protein